MPKLVCLSPVEHDGQWYAVGAELEVSQDQAESLIEVHAAQLAEAAPAAASADPIKRGPGRPRKAD